MTARTSTKTRTGFLATLGVACMLLTACGPTPESIARDACDLGQEVLSGDVGLVGAASTTRSIVEEAREADITMGEVLSAARDECPDAIDELPF